jgi:DNA-binding transcriptional ArsR family regulator
MNDSCDHSHEAQPRARPPSSDATLERAARVFRAVADPARLRLLERLEEGDVCVSELATSLGLGISTVSQQLRVLFGERLVARRRHGKHIYYRLADQHITSLVRSVLDHVEEPADAHEHDGE